MKKIEKIEQVVSCRFGRKVRRNFMEQKQTFIINILYYAILLFLAVLVLQYAVPILTPFIVAFVIVWILRIPASYIARKLHLPEKPLRLFMIILFYGGIVTLLFTVGLKISSSVGKFADDFPQMYKEQIVPIINQVFGLIEETIARMEPNLLAELEKLSTQVIQNVGQWVSEISVSLVKNVSNYAAGVPAFFVKLIISIVSSFFIAADYEKIMELLYRVLPKKILTGIRTLKKYAANVLTQYLKSYALIFCITFLELSIGLWILRIPYAIAVAGVIAVFDILPILGLGGVLIPWTIISIIMGQYMRALGLILLYIIITIIRNIIEPKIIGMQIGLHPLATLIGMFVGLKLFGILGLFGIPITLSICLQLYRKGIIRFPEKATEKKQKTK